MCGRYLIEFEEENIEFRKIFEDLNKKYKSPKIKLGEICPTDIAPIIKTDINNRLEVSLLSWGFPNQIEKKGVIINARQETLREKSTFKNLLSSKRCLVPAKGFFEWSSEGGIKSKHLIQEKNSRLIYMAGLYQSFITKDENIAESFVIITTEANLEMSKLHDRMPVILNKDEQLLWLNNKLFPFGKNDRELSIQKVGTSQISLFD